MDASYHICDLCKATQRHANLQLFLLGKHAETNKLTHPNISLSDSPPLLYPAAADLGRIYAAQSQRLH